MLKFIVASCGRSGSLFFARLMTALGYPCGHESFFDFTGWRETQRRLHYSTYEKKRRMKFSDISSAEQWTKIEDITSDSSYMAAPFLSQEEIKHVPIIHVVRHPFKVITSFLVDFHYFYQTDTNDPWQRFIYAHLPELLKIKEPVERACYYYVYWNKMIQAACHKNRKYFLQQVEKPITKQFRDFIQSQVELPVLPNNINSKRKSDKFLELKDIPDGEIKQSLVVFSGKLGYNLADVLSI